MVDIPEILDSLKKTPLILENLVKRIPNEKLKLRRIPESWSIHEHACHIVDVQPLMNERFKVFIMDSKPTFESYFPGKIDSDSHLIKMNLEKSLHEFYNYREELFGLLENVQETYWRKKGEHGEYLEYTPYILLRHLLMHEYYHMYRIELLWLTVDAYLLK